MQNGLMSAVTQEIVLMVFANAMLDLKVSTAKFHVCFFLSFLECMLVSTLAFHQFICFFQLQKTRKKSYWYLLEVAPIQVKSLTLKLTQLAFWTPIQPIKVKISYLTILKNDSLVMHVESHNSKVLLINSFEIIHFDKVQLKLSDDFFQQKMWFSVKHSDTFSRAVATKLAVLQQTR